MTSADSATYQHLAAITAARLADFNRRSARGEGRVLSMPPIDQLRHDLGLDELIQAGAMDPEGFSEFLDGYLDHTTRLHHPGSLAHQVAVPDFPAALADAIHGALNNPGGLYEMGAANQAIEATVVDWMLGMAGHDPAVAGGVLTHGGSLANLTALAGARAAAAPEAWERGTPGDLVVLAPAAAHYSVARAVSLLGLGSDAIVDLPCDSLGRILPGRIPHELERLQALGKRPMALVAAACATSTGLHDDLAAIGAICAEHGVWLHVDAAHGGSALLSPADRQLLDGIDQADSLIWDAHKMLRTSSLCAAVLFKRRERLEGAFRQQASYVFYEDGDGVDSLDRTFECTKAPLGLKLFLNLAWRGECGLGDYVAGRYAATREFAAQIRARPGFEVPYEPEANILLFRLAGDDALQLRVRERLMADGDFHLSSAELAGRRHLRITVTSPSTDAQAIERMLDRIEAIAGRGAVATA